MYCKQLTVLVLFLVIVDISRSSEVHKSVHEHALLNSDVLNKKLLPDVKHLLKGNSDGSRQKFLKLLSTLDVDGYKFVNGMFFEIFIKIFKLNGLNEFLHYFLKYLLEVFPHTHTNSHDRDSFNHLLPYFFRSPSFRIPHAFICLNVFDTFRFLINIT